MKKVIIISVIVCCTFMQSRAQDKNPLFSQYMFNGLTMNPAYAGSHDVFSASLLSRYQWIGFQGAPINYALNLHGPGKNTKTGWGANMLYETRGIRQTVGFYGNYAFRLTLGSGSLSMGLKAGFASEKQNQEALNLTVDDPAFSENNSDYFLPNFGVGFYYKTRRFFAGLSVPLMLSTETNENGTIGAHHEFSKYAYYLTAGIHIKPDIDWLITPSLLVQYQARVPVIAGAVNVMYKEVFGAGLSYRSSEAVIMLVNYRIGYQTTIGIAYDFGFSGFNQSIPDYESNRNSVEIALQIDLGFKINRSNPIIF